MSGTNALMLPTQNPATRFAGPAGPPIGLQGPQMPASALQVPAAPSPPAGAQAPPGPAPGPIAPGVHEVSARVPAPATDFHPDTHDDLHKQMGAAFDKPKAAGVVREAYDAIRGAHPHIHPEAALLSARDAYHAVQHGFISDHAAAKQIMLDHPGVLAHPHTTAYHGSPHDFDRFDSSRLHPDEAGHYFALDEKHAKDYADPHMYEVKIKADLSKFLDYGRLSPQQRDDLNDRGKLDRLKASGVPGIRFPDRTITVFDPSVIDIMRKYARKEQKR